METQEDPNEPMDVNNSDSESDSSNDEEEQMLLTRVEELERQISENKYLYNVHEELVNLYRKLGDLKSMRLAYERFHEYFPLTPEIWLAWINDEKKLANSESDVKGVFALFDKAVEDYLSVNLWMEYAQYSIGASDLQTTHDILERGLTAAGLHAAEGSLLWDTYKELEFAHLSLAQEGSDEWKEQILKIVEVFRRQLSVPLIGMESTFTEWQEWAKQLPQDVSINSQAVEWGYNKALKVLEKYKPFEDRLAASEESQLLPVYKEYVRALQDPSTILCVYERAVAQMCLDTEIWLDYCSYALNLGEAADKVSTRALRNCPWSEDLWITRLRILEHLGKAESEVLSCFEQGMASVVANNQGTELWLAYLEYTNRTSTSKEKFYKLFDQALEQLGYKNDGYLKVAKWYARTLAKNGNMPQARKLWKDILKIPENKQAATVWLAYANLEREFGETNQLRSLFQRALTSCSDWPHYIAEEWIMLERESGTLADVLKCTEKCKEVVARQAQKMQATETNPKASKRKLESDHNDTNTKKQKNEEVRIAPPKTKLVKDPKTTVFVSNLYPSINEKKLKKVFPNATNIEIVADRKGRSRCYGYVQFKMEEEVAHALARDRELLEGRPIFISNCKPDRNERKAAFKYSVEAESNKLFVRGLPVDKTQEDVEGIFKAYGAVSVRLVLHKSGQPKGLAYVEFENDDAAKNAMKKTDQTKIGEHTITVAISAPPQKKQVKAPSSTPVRHSRSRLQVPMIPRSLQVKNDKVDATNGDSKSKSNADFRKMLLNN